jgi:hypothetical protein
VLIGEANNVSSDAFAPSLGVLALEDPRWEGEVVEELGTANEGKVSTTGEMGEANAEAGSR